MSNPNVNVTPPPKPWERQIIVVTDGGYANRLVEMLAEGYKLDPYLPPVKLEKAWIVPLIKGDYTALDANPNVVAPVTDTVEQLEGFMSVQPDDTPDGPLSKLLKEGWVYVGFTGTKNLVQIKKPKKVD